MRNLTFPTNTPHVLRSSDGVDPMDANVQDIDTSYPVIAAGTKQMLIREVKEADNNDKTGKNLVLKIETTQSERNHKGGDDIPKGHIIMVYIGITELPVRMSSGTPALELRAVTRSDIARNIAGPAKAAGLSMSPKELLDNPQALSGKPVLVEVGVRPAKNGYPASNVINEWLKPR